MIPRITGKYKEFARRNASLLLIVITAAVSFAVYSNALLDGFVFDDHDQVVANPWIKDIGNIPAIFSGSAWNFLPEIITSNYYRPLMHAVYIINYYVFGLDPLGFHLVNILFHAGASILVFILTRQILLQFTSFPPRTCLFASFASSILFSVHPIHTEAVTWIAGLPDVAFSFFCLLSFYLYSRSRKGSGRTFVYAAFFFLLSMFFKETAVTFPLILLAYDLASTGKKNVSWKSPARYILFFVTVGIYFFFRVLALGSVIPETFHGGFNACKMVVNIFPLLMMYMNKLLLPFNLNPFYTFTPIDSVLSGMGLLSLFGSMMSLLLLVAALKRNKGLFLGLVFLIVPLMPALFTTAISSSPFAERYLYLPSFGFTILSALFISEATIGRKKGLTLFSLLLIASIGLLSITTVKRNSVWREDYSLFSDAAKKSPGNMMARRMLGTALLRKGLKTEAAAELEIAAALPGSADDHCALGNFFYDMGWTDKAIQQFQAALGIEPGSATAHYDLGAAFAKRGFQDKAAEEYRMAIRLRPDFAQAHNNLGSLFYRQGSIDIAIMEYQTAVELYPRFAHFHFNLGKAFQRRGWIEQAIKEYHTALTLNPDSDADLLHNNLGFAYYKKGWIQKSIEEYSIALSLNPELAVAHNNLGLAYGKVGLIEKATMHFNAAIRLNKERSGATVPARRFSD